MRDGSGRRVTRRGFIAGAAGILAGLAGIGGYAFGIEPLLRLSVTRYRIAPAGWPAGLKLRIAALADIHTCDPWMTAGHVRSIVDAANALRPDITVLLGDYISHQRFAHGAVPYADWAGELGRLVAPLGVHAILGNHDWWDDPDVQRRRAGPTPAGRALQAAGIPVYENDARRLVKDGIPFWLGGLGDQWAFYRRRIGVPYRDDYAYDGVDDLDGLLAKVTDDAPLVLLVHEPDIFPRIPPRAAVTLCGHTHGGQVRLFGYSPVVPSRFGNRYAYGHVVEDGRHLVISGGLGCSIMPVRFGMPPEIVLVDLGA